MTVIPFPAAARPMALRIRATVPRPVPAALVDWLKLWLERRAYRRMLRTELLTQPDSVLADAGFSRVEALTECAKPFWRR